MPAQGPEADLSQWLAAPFGPDLRLQTTVCLRCRTGLAGEILDRWGREVTLVPVRDGFTVTAPAVLGPAFWGWLAAQGEKVTLLSPTWAVEAWKTMVPSSCLWPGSGLETRGERCLVRG